MREEGMVVTVHDGSVDVRMQPSTNCAGCSVCSQGAGGETVMHDVTDAHGATVGDIVSVSIPDGIRSRAAAAVFLVPVACLLAGYLAGFLLGGWLGKDPETTAVIGALASVTVGMLGIRLAERTVAGNAAFAPRVDAIISRGRGQQ
ncbi:MAG: SoxR reducing system RseC family protein [Coriobacteriia bacterium]|nr:SoxR reducing system RseC family protein [Coriobacteriia bacterium]MBN2839956.1 SoxR reducing system RseC family protein [Coriobacteriia bacterium]